MNALKQNKVFKTIFSIGKIAVLLLSISGIFIASFVVSRISSIFIASL